MPTRRWPVLAELPAEVSVVEGARGVLAVRREYADALAALGFGPDGGDPPAASDLAGRRPLGELAVRGERLVVRSFHHGGMLRWATRSRFAVPERPFRELILATRLEQLGLPTPRVVAARARRAPVAGWRLDLVSRRVDGARDLAEWLEALREGRVAEAARRAVASGVGRFLGRLHAAGFRHADLNPRNLLLQGESLEGTGAKPWVIDLDRSILRPPLADGERFGNLSRLLRAVIRREERGALFLRRTDFVRFLAGYLDGLGAPRAALKREARSILSVYARASSVHRAWWRIEAAFGGGPAARDGGAVVRRPRRSPPKS